LKVVGQPLMQKRVGWGDSGYSSLENLKFLRHEKVGFLFGVADGHGFLFFSKICVIF